MSKGTLQVVGLSLILFCFSANAQPSLTTITDTLYNSILGTPFNGTAVVEGPNVTGPGNVTILATSRPVSIVNGAFSVSVVPNQSSSPASTYSITFSNGDIKTCNVPVSLTPLTIVAAGCVDGTQPTAPGVIALSQLASGGATAGQALCFNGTYWAPGNCGSTGAAVWGMITGTLSSQSDLSTALNGKQPTITGAPGTWPNFAVVATTGRYSDLLGLPSLASYLTGTPVNHGVAIGASGQAITFTTPGTVGQALTSNGPSANATFQAVNATRINGAAVPINTTLLYSDSLGQLHDNGKVTPSEAQSPPGSRPAAYFAFTDGSGVNAPGACVIFTTDFLGNMIAGNDIDGNCLMGSGGFFSVFSGQILQPSGTGKIKANQVTLASGTLPTCAVGNRGQFWYVAGASGVTDSVSVCAKDSANTFAWRVIF